MNATDTANATAFKTVRFGSYPQTSTGASFPINWLVVHEDGPCKLLISEFSLLIENFASSTQGTACWGWSHLRDVADAFARTAFSDAELALIQPVTLPESPDAQPDLVFVPSSSEAQRLGNRRLSLLTPWAAARAGMRELKLTPCDWWLRDTPNLLGRANAVGAAGHVLAAGLDSFVSEAGFRPCLWLKAA